MKIGIISREYPPHNHVGGIATYSATIAKILSDHGHEVHVICNGPTNELEKKAGIWIHQLQMLPHPLAQSKWLYLYRKWFRKILPNYLESITWANTAASYLDHQLDLSSFDVIEYPETSGEGSLITELKTDKPFRVARIHSGWTKESSNHFFEAFFLLGFQKKACLKAQRIVSPSKYMVDAYAKKILHIKKKIMVRKNAFQAWPTQIAWEQKKISHLLYVGRIEHRKGLQTLLDALEKLGPNLPEVQVRIVGNAFDSGRERDLFTQNKLKAMLQRQNNAAKGTAINFSIDHLGAIPNEEIRQYFDWAGILVIPSLMENYPYVALEGLSRGCFLIGSNVGGIPEIIDRPSRGMLFEVENSTQLAEKIRECMHREFEIAAGRATVVNELNLEFSSEKTYQDLMEIYGDEFANEGKKERV